MEHFLTPVLALIMWTFIMWVWMYITRIPAMTAVTKNTQKFIDDPSMYEKIPAKVRWKADNYNHLHEQPVLFYALMFYLFLTSQTDAVMLYLAWGYVIIRVLQSLDQVTIDKVIPPFGLFLIGSIMLLIMGFSADLALF